MNNKLVISIVSHGHDDYIIKNKFLIELTSAEGVIIIIKDNVCSTKLKNFAQANKIVYLSNDKAKGFGANNNDIFEYAASHYSFYYFLCINPDVLIEKHVLLSFLDILRKDNRKIATLNLYLDKGFSVYDLSVRRFPTLFDFVKSFIFKRNPSIIDKSNIETPCKVDWAAGSFLIFEKSVYADLGGFDESFFMYCEDLDICWRANRLLNLDVYYYPQYKAVHFAAHNNRNVFSKHFFWHIKGVFKFLANKALKA